MRSRFIDKLSDVGTLILKTKIPTVLVGYMLQLRIRLLMTALFLTCLWGANLRKGQMFQLIMSRF